MNPARRSLLGGLGLLPLGLLGCSSPDAAAPRPASSTPTVSPGRRLEAEWGPHARTFMSWPSAAIWGSDIAAVRAEIAGLAGAIAEFEPVTMLVSPDDAAAAAEQCGAGITLAEIAVDDLWARDTVPVFVSGDGGVAGIDLNFNGWGGKQDHDHDSKVAAVLLEQLGLPRISTSLVAEGGSFETDGEGTLLVTRSSLLNPNRNPGLTEDELTAQLVDLLGVSKVIWFDGVVGQDITDAHVDCMARFVAPGVVLLDVPDPADEVWSGASRQAREVLAQQTDAVGREFTVIDLPQPDFDVIRGEGEEFLASYANFHIANGAVFVPEFGDPAADAHAQEVLQQHFPDREVVAVNIDTIASGGGGIHCATHDLPGE